MFTVFFTLELLTKILNKEVIITSEGEYSFADKQKCNYNAYRLASAAVEVYKGTILFGCILQGSALYCRV